MRNKSLGTALLFWALILFIYPLLTKPPQPVYALSSSLTIPATHISPVYLPAIFKSPEGIFGLMIPMDTPGRTAATELGGTYYRSIGAVFASMPLYCLGCDSATMDGFSLVITIRANNDGTPATDIAAYASFIENFVVTYQPWAIVIENEESSPEYFAGTALQYGTQLEIACNIAAIYGVKCMNGGLSSRDVLLMVWQNVYGGYPNPDACTFARAAFSYYEAYGLCAGASQDVLERIARSETFYNLYSTSSIDYVNLHFYIEETESGTNASVVIDAINYMRSSGKPVFINEWGMRVDDAQALVNVMAIMNQVDLSGAIYFSPYPSEVINVVSLQNKDGTLTNLGETYRDYIDNIGLNQK